MQTMEPSIYRFNVMQMLMGMGYLFYFDIYSEVKAGSSYDVKMKMDDEDETRLFVITRSASGWDCTYTSKVDEYAGMYIKKTDGGYPQFWLGYKIKNENHLTKKEFSFFTKKHTFTLTIGKTSYTFTDLYIQPPETYQHFCYTDIEDAGNGLINLTIEDCGLNIGDVGDTGKGSYTGYTIMKKTETKHNGWTYVIQITAPKTTTELYKLYFSFDTLPRSNQYWRATGKYTDYSVTMYDLFLPRMYIKANGEIYRVVTHIREEGDRAAYIRYGETPISSARYFIKTAGNIYEVEMKNI